MPQNQIASLYKLRLEIAKDHGKFDDACIKYNEIIVSNLQQSNLNELGITWLNTDHDGSYLIFYEPDTLNILGILKAKSVLDQMCSKQE